MHRIAAATLCLIFALQSGGTAAAQTFDSRGTGIKFSGILAPLETLLGYIGGYGIKHVAPPTMERPEQTVSAAEIMRGQHALRPVIRKGTPHPFERVPLSELNPHKRSLDPLAMRRSTVRATPKPSAFLNLLKPEPPGTASSNSIVLQPQHGTGMPTSSRSKRQIGPAQRGQLRPMASSASGTGIEPWWTYEERPIPGIGKAMVNVGTGNLLVSALDVDVPEQGIDLAFQRVYNAQSLHDVNGDDGGEPAIYGNLWTNTFDASIVYNPSGPTMTVYDIDGTACTYNSDGQGNWIPCTGEHATLQPVSGSDDCLYAWTKTDGTQYVFHTDQTSSGCTIADAKHGRLQQINARNQTNNITFTYSYNGQGQSAEDITKIVVTHSDGQSLTLNFGLIAGTYNELATITLPDGAATLQYYYDKSGNLLEVDKPGNNSASLVPANPNTGATPPPGDAPETYGYVTGSYTMNEACGPRCTVAMWNNPTSPANGSALLFTLNSSQQLRSWQVQGVMNFTPSDGTHIPLQSGPSTNFTTWYTTYFVYNQGSDCSDSSAGTTTMCDSDSHNTIWTIDGNQRVTETQDYTGAAEAAMLTTSQTWDANNDLTSTTDPNDFTTKYGYDTGGTGNMVEMQLPRAGDVSPAATSPLSYYSYDQNHNIVAYCDPVYNQTNGNSWVNSPGNNLCPGGKKTTVMTYTTQPTGPEPYGCLTSITKPSGYQTDIQYGSAQGCGVGLPTLVAADQSFNQYDGSSRQPTQDFSYDGYGNLSGYDRGKSGGGAHIYDSWALGYDPDNRNESRTQQDPAMSAIISYTCYYPDGSVFYTETPSQHNLDGDQPCPGMQTIINQIMNNNLSPPSLATFHQYDLDGNELEITTHKGCTANNGCVKSSQTTCNPSESEDPIGTTCKYYDGLDRLVETAEPYDTRSFAGGGNYEFYNFRWMNRYIYDLSMLGASANLKISDNTGTVAGLVAYGNLYKTQEYIPHAKTQALGQSPGTPSWYDVRGTSFDALSRPISKYELAYGTTPVTTNTYDAAGDAGNLSEVENAVGQVIKYTHDSIERLLTVTYSGAPLASAQAYTYDADGRIVQIADTGDSFGNISYTYDVDGHRTSVLEPSGENAASLICYAYYPDGTRAYLAIGLPGDNCGTNTNGIPPRKYPNIAGISQPQLFSYAYREDGLLESQLVTWSSNQELFAWTYYDSGREETESDPLTNTHGFVAKSYSYDNYGRVSGLTLPEGQFQESVLTYDTDDELAGYTASAGGSNTTRQFTLNARGELLEDSYSNSVTSGYGQGPTYSANGTQVGNGDCRCTGGTIVAPPTTLQFDARTGMANCIPNPQWPTNTDNFAYLNDAAGRQAGWTQDTSGCAAPSQVGARTFDAENRLAKTILPLEMNQQGPSTCTEADVTWGVDGRQRSDDLKGCYGGDQTMTAHWDGGAMLFSTQPSPVLYIGKLAVMDQSGDIIVSDRDQTGAQASTHGSVSGTSFFSDWALGSVRTATIAKNGSPVNITLFPGNCSQSGCPGIPAAYAMIRSDGYQMVGGIVQGARTYDPTSGQWTTPDAFAGDVNDPMSQKPFIWNGNNPTDYDDLSGLNAEFQSQSGTNAQPLTIDSAEGDPNELQPVPNTVIQGIKNAAAALSPAERAFVSAVIGAGVTSGFGTVGEAGYGAALSYTALSNSWGIELGSPLYEQQGLFGFGPYTPGQAAVVTTDTTKIPEGSSLVGIWHSHPLLGQTDDHTSDFIDFQKSYPGSAFIFFTSVNGDLKEQDISSSGEIGSTSTICSACVPSPINSVEGP